MVPRVICLPLDITITVDAFIDFETDLNTETKSGERREKLGFLVGFGFSSLSLSSAFVFFVFGSAVTV